MELFCWSGVVRNGPIDRALFSATLPAPIRSIAQNYLNDPARITIKKKTMTADSIRQIDEQTERMREFIHVLLRLTGRETN